MKNLILFCLVVFGLSSCVNKTIYYTPMSSADMDLEHKNDVKASVKFIDASDESNYQKHSRSQWEGSVMWSPKENIGLSARSMRYSEAYTETHVDGWTVFDIPYNESFNFKQRLIYSEVGVGYYELLDNNWRFNTSISLGAGSSNLRESIHGRLEYKYRKMGLHGTVAKSWNRFEMGSSLSFSSIDYYHVRNQFSERFYDRGEYLNEIGVQTLVERSLFFTFKTSAVDTKFEFGKSSSMTNSDFRQNNDFVSVGLVFDLDRMLYGQNK